MKKIIIYVIALSLFTNTTNIMGNAAPPALVQRIRSEVQSNELVSLYRQREPSLSDNRTICIPVDPTLDPEQQELQIRLQEYQNLLNAARKGYSQIVTRTLARGVTPYCSDTEGRTPLHNAALACSVKSIQEIIKAEKAIRGRCSTYWDRSHNNCNLCTGAGTISRVDDRGKTPIDLSLQLIDEKITAHQPYDTLESGLVTLFLWAVEENAQAEVQKVLYFFSNQPVCPAFQFADPKEGFNSALHLVAREANVQLLTILLNSIPQHRLDRAKATKNNMSQTPRDCAASHNDSLLYLRLPNQAALTCMQSL